MIRRPVLALAKCILATVIMCGAGTGALALAAEPQERDIRAADTSSPRDTLRSFIDATNELHQLINTSAKHYDRTNPEHIALAERALDCLDDSELPAFTRVDRAGQAAVALKEILDRVQLPPWDQVPDRAEIMKAGGFEGLSHYRIPDTRITISRVEQGPRRHEYLFSPGTVERAPRYFANIESKPYRVDGPQVSTDFYRWYLSAPGHPALGAVVEMLPEGLRLGRTWGLANWKWPGLVLTVLVGLALMVVTYRTQVAVTQRAREKNLLAYWLTIVFPIAAMLIPLGVEYVGYRHLTMRGTPLYVLEFSTALIALLAAIAVIDAATSRIAASVIASPDINPEGLNAQLIKIVSKLAGLVAVVILFLVGGQYLGIPIATLLASAGIGGIAIALGAQDTLKTLFGTVMLLSDKPFSVGDRIVFKEYEGVVEDIGLRSTQLRLLAGPLVTLPNDQLAGNNIENVSRQQYIRRVGEILVPLDSPCEKMVLALRIVRDALHDREGMDPDHPPRVFFDEFASGAFRVRFYYWYAPPDHWGCREFGDKLNLEIFRRFEAEGIQFSLPLRHSFWKNDDAQGPLDVQLLSQEGRERV